MPQGTLGSFTQKLGFGSKAWQFAVLSFVDMSQTPVASGKVALEPPLLIPTGHMLLGPSTVSRAMTQVSSRFGSVAKSASAAAYSSVRHGSPPGVTSCTFPRWPGPFLKYPNVPAHCPDLLGQMFPTSGLPALQRPAGTVARSQRLFG
jgi:hypothetical protein